MKPLRVLLVSRPNLHQQPGGDTLHLEQNRHYLDKLAVRSELYDGSQNPEEFDLIHFYGLTRPANVLPLLNSKKPFVVSSIYVDYSEADRTTSRIRAFLQKGLGQHALEYLKLVARARKGRDQWPGKSYLLEGQKGSIRKILDNCNYLITASEAEYDSIKTEFPFEGKHKTVKLGVEHLPPLNPAEEKKDVLCVARIEPIKNQLSLIKAQKGSDWKLHLSGGASPAHGSYLAKCKKAAGPKVLFHGQRNYEECAAMYNKAQVHVLPSLYETTGLATLEAMYYGCQVVVNDSNISKELFGEHAFYAKVQDPDSLKKTIHTALQSKSDHRDWLKKEFSWELAAQSIREVYDKVLNQRK